jgi:hypothetical protein
MIYKMSTSGDPVDNDFRSFIGECSEGTFSRQASFNDQFIVFGNKVFQWKDAVAVFGSDPNRGIPSSRRSDSEESLITGLLNIFISENRIVWGLGWGSGRTHEIINVTKVEDIDDLNIFNSTRFGVVVTDSGPSLQVRFAAVEIFDGSAWACGIA